MEDCVKVYHRKLEDLNFCINTEKNSNYPQSSILIEELYDYIINNFKDDKNLYLENLINFSIIVKDYPKRIIRKGTKNQSGIKFGASIMCLLKSEVDFKEVEIKAFMCSFNSAENKLVQTKISPNYSPKHVTIDDNNCWIIKNMTYLPEDPSRSSRTSTCEKKIILFKFESKYTSPYLSTHLCKDLYSDTLVLVSHSHQDIDCLITLFWDDYYRVNRNFISDGFQFICKDFTTFEDLIENLSDYFLRETNRPLSMDNKMYLLQKVREIYKSRILKLSDFMKTQLPGSRLSFARWIMSIIKMLQTPTLKILWENDFIEGFICKDPNHRLPRPGSFLLRFSERKSAIGVVVKTEDGTLEPWSPYDDGLLQKNNLANQLDFYDILEFLVKANGEIVNRKEALEPYMDTVPINDGYTKRGGHYKYNMSYSEDTNSQEIETVDNSIDLAHSMTEDDIPCDLNDILSECDCLLQNYELMEIN